MKTHLQDLIESTAQFHYEGFRSKQLIALKEQSAALSQVSVSPSWRKSTNQSSTLDSKEMYLDLMHDDAFDDSWARPSALNSLDS